MAELNIDPFVSVEPEVQLDSETLGLLKERMRSADEGRLVSAEEARQRIQQWLSNSATKKTL
jgi:predicted transcriptional regulator